METKSVKCSKCKKVFMVPVDLILNKSSQYDNCPNCKEQNCWDEHKE